MDDNLLRMVTPMPFYENEINNDIPLITEVPEEDG